MGILLLKCIECKGLSQDSTALLGQSLRHGLHVGVGRPHLMEPIKWDPEGILYARRK